MSEREYSPPAPLHSPPCDHCLEYGHTVENCPKMRCNYCKSPDHLLSDGCPKIWCNFCENNKHTTKSCRVFKCFHCGERHRTKDCGYKNMSFM